MTGDGRERIFERSENPPEVTIDGNKLLTINDLEKVTETWAEKMDVHDVPAINVPQRYTSFVNIFSGGLENAGQIGHISLKPNIKPLVTRQLPDKRKKDGVLMLDSDDALTLAKFGLHDIPTLTESQK